jgi:uncharacterized protein
MNVEQRSLCFSCRGDELYGIVSLPEKPSSRGVLVIVGGPQYRAGSHRQFTLLANDLSAQGTPVMRFDYRGMGDSEGEARTFEAVQDDIRVALDRFHAEVPALKEVVLWGLCDAASASLFYAHSDSRVTGLVLLNPWVRTTEGMAKAYLRHYYLARVTDKELWTKILAGRFDFGGALRSLLGMVGKAATKTQDASPGAAPAGVGSAPATVPLPDRMYEGLAHFKGKVLLIISGNDLTAKEFLDLVNGSRKWKKALESARVQRRDLPEANHTFARRDWRNQVANWTRDWIKSW